MMLTDIVILFLLGKNFTDEDVMEVMIKID